ncbi:MAG: UDP-N-acetyl-D-mannosamine dehydrogenase, partial [Thermoplasmata archaeon]|nr:UDP-N-acetyl-D-mannosamine dehydrogenase [Thermoplasmata archaeon]
MKEVVDVDVCVIGLGYIGLPTSAIMASKGHSVTGVDTDTKLLEEIRSIGAQPEEPGLAELVKRVLAEGNMHLSSEAVVSDVFILCLPTPLLEDKKADLSSVRSGMTSVLKVLKKGDMIVLESTVPPGTTAGIVADMVRESGLDPLEDVDLAFAPERVIPGNIL